MPSVDGADRLLAYIVMTESFSFHNDTVHRSVAGALEKLNHSSVLQILWTARFRKLQTQHIASVPRENMFTPDNNRAGSMGLQKKIHKKNKRHRPPVSEQQCWFCRAAASQDDPAYNTHYTVEGSDGGRKLAAGPAPLPGDAAYLAVAREVFERRQWCGWGDAAAFISKWKCHNQYTIMPQQLYKGQKMWIKKKCNKNCGTLASGYTV